VALSLLRTGYKGMKFVYNEGDFILTKSL